VSERRNAEPRPRDHTDAARDVSRELADVTGQLAHLEGEAMNRLDDPNYSALRLRSWKYPLAPSTSSLVPDNKLQASAEFAMNSR